MTTGPISLADHRARRLIDRLVSIQVRIDQSARVLLAGRRSAEKLETLLDDMDRVLRELDRTAEHVVSEDLRRGIEGTVTAHMRWSHARLGSDEERSAAALYLDSVDALARIASAR